MLRHLPLYLSLAIVLCLRGPAQGEQEAPPPEAKQAEAKQPAAKQPELVKLNAEQVKVPLCCGQQAQFTSLQTTATYFCPLYPMGPAGGGLYLYYAAQWTAGVGCGANPRPLYLNIPNAAGCPTDPADPDPDVPHYCIQVGGAVPVNRKDKPKSGCEIGYNGPDKPRWINDSNTLDDSRRGTFLIDGKKVKVQFYKVELWLPDDSPWECCVGFQIPGYTPDIENFPTRTEDIVCMGPKCFTVNLDDDGEDVNYWVLLRPGTVECK